MIARRTPGNSGPITWVGRVPVYATTVLVALHISAMIALAILMASGATGVQSLLAFDTGAVLREFEVWRCITYGFVNRPDPWFIVSLVMLYIFGKDVEQYLGRQGFVRLYLGFLLLGPSLLLTASLVTGRDYSLTMCWANFAVLLSFASIYPNAALVFQLPAKLFAWVFLGIYALQLLAARAWIDLTVLLATALLAWYAVRGERIADWPLVERLRVPRRRRAPHLRIVRDEEEGAKRQEEEDPHAVIDPLLEKISRAGLSSLTPRERAQLEKARAALIQQDGR